MHRFYCPSQNISDNTIIIDNKEQVHHAKNVLRLKVHEEVFIFDAQGNEYCSILDKSLPKSMVFKIKSKKNFMLIAKKVKITVACAIPKGSRMDEIIDKLTQLGVDRIIPLKTSRVVIKLDKYKELERWKRWNKIAQSASEQNQRNTLPVVDKIKDIEEALSDSGGFDLKLIPTLIGERKTLKEILSVSKPQNILVLIGPEGDFSPAEVDSAKKRSFIPVSLGDFVLRVETAAISVASFIRLYEDR